MALDNGYHFAAQALPTPTDAPYDSPFVDVSTQSSTRGSSSPSSDNFLVPFPLDKNSYFPKLQETTDDGNIDKTPAQESRRFTPNNLGISLVAQIHSLRKELGSKDSMMENLEEHLHKSRAENEQLSKDLKTQKAEVTSVKKQMQSLEREMLQALEETAKERDNALETVADTRKRLEDSTRKVRAQEEDANKAHALWEKDRQTWDDKRRKLESRVHTVEERLKTMVAEMLIVKSTDQRSVGMGDDVDEGMKDSCFGNGNDPPGISATSRLSNRGLDESYESNRISNLRSSRMSGLHSLGGSQMSGLSLAEELEFEQGENSAEEEDNDKNAQPGDTYTLARRSSVDEEVRRDFHADADEEPLGDETSGQHSIGIINDYIDFPGKKLGNHYTDTGTQLSPPRSPSLPQQEPGVSEKCIEQTEPTANQSRKRINIPQVFVEQTLATPQPKTLSMISIGSQTIRQPEDPASTAKAANSTSGSAPFGATEMKSACTQTVQDPIPVSKSANSHLSPSSMDVPVIAIHPPASIPSSSRNGVMLPPRTKNAACQVIIELPRYMKSKSMQTEERRVDKRPVRIPPRLSSSDHPTQAPPQLAERRKQAGTVSGPEPSAHRLPSQARAKTEGKQPSVRTPRTKNAYSGHNDDGPLNHKQRHGPRRPIRSGSIFAGFDVSSDDDSKNAEDHFSDDEFLNAAPVRKTLSKVQNSWKLVPHLKDSVLERLESASEEAENEKRASVPKPAAAKAKPQSHTTSKTFHIRQMESYRTALSNAKQPDIRRKALVSNGVRKHGQRSSIPSESNVLINEATIAPPFPVPARLSSRKVPLSASDEAASPSPHTKTFFSARRGQSNDKSHNKRKILRKVQSAAAVTQPAVPLRLASLQSLSASSTVPPSPKSTAPRRSQFISPYSSNVAGLSSHSTLPQSRAGETSVEAPREQTSVVDTIAQTMVGEWMWKYVRKRTSFGITENPHAEFELGRNGDNGNGSGVRHKRWVWLAPFERAVIWSSKQPTSGPALLGKGGRKLTIQSVLDVKDDTPLPKNAGPQAIFNRSILILTPQRALKFTAISRERHYIWLAALSYLSHPTQGMDDLASLPPLSEHGYQSLPSQEPLTGFGPTGIHESVRTAKIKARPSVGVHSYSSPTGLIGQEIIEGVKLPWEDEEAESDNAAEPPQVHRVAAHARKRSNTGPRPGPLSAFYSYPNSSMVVASSCSLQCPTSREKYDRYTPQLQVGSGINPTHSTLIRGLTESSNAQSPVVPDNFFDSAATIRMEAFIDGKEKECVLSTRGKSYGARQGRKKDVNFWGFDASAARSAMGSSKFKGEDPFTGF